MIKKTRRVLSVLAIGALILGIPGTGAIAATDADFNVTATVLANLTLTKTADLSFGSFAANTGGSVTIAPTLAGARSSAGTVMPIVTAPGVSAKFDVTGENLAYTVTLPANPTLTETVGDVQTMGVVLTAGTTSGGAGTDGTIAGGVDTVFIGGTVTVANGQLVGLYRIGGSVAAPINVSIAYD